MKQHVILILSLILNNFILAQTTISGKVIDTKDLPIASVNVYLEGTYDGATTNEQGEFSFTTEEKGTQVLVISFLSYETKSITEDVSKMNKLIIKLRDDVSSLDTVVISAGTFEASDNSKVSVLNSLDVVTTASALGDFVGALQTLPGTSNVAEDGRLFVRGGSADETQIFIDGIRVFTPFSPTPNNIPTRGRYSPFLFDGITFSTGGYSAEYGQALSSVLLLNTIDEPDQEKTDVGVMTLGGSLGNTQKWEKSSLSINATYINLAPYLEVFDDRNDWENPYQGAQGEAVFRQQTNSGLLKFYAAFDTANFKLTQEDINQTDGLQFQLKNNNFYANASYKGILGNDWSLTTGLSYTIADTDIGIETSDITGRENSLHAKVKIKKRFSSRFKLNFGVEQFLTDFSERFQDVNIDATIGFNNNITAAFTEADIIFSKSLALKAGVRLDYSSIFETSNFAPRLSLAYKTSKNSQMSLAYGNFFQNPNSNVLKFETDLQAQQTSHYIFNYQYVNNGKIFRTELYRKDYDNLVKFDTPLESLNTNFTSNGDGFAQGLDVFWRDNTSVKNLDYWASYSYLDTERNDGNFPIAAQPSFAAKHNLSLVTKYWIEDWKSQIGLAYSFASGRPYTNPNTTQFLGERTKAFNNLSFNWAYLLSQQKILYFSVNNILGFNNINGYQYANTPNANGVFNRRALRPAADQFFFVGFFWTISENGTDNQLDNL
ncbi:TonB-dependent receptor [Winogradskyella immobilis]|uniref:Carboxypeptidase-like regulatory domain-containing protein n=1 Tax=Winogradskyella immobilis TaxID=2816852 RepID=A0ABS8EPT8_9FLAO|nr:TonB-dependent receptor [Winogradskyella immobilis]MCC1484852.1 carboxypeptidase-like regulatory domain-containing protein [Winogradskyella immobilis]MCG0016944.1 TonB-dependent receptor [Winogradskyella immobilis]